jgi:hypothetical protein
MLARVHTDFPGIFEIAALQNSRVLHRLSGTPTRGAKLTAIRRNDLRLGTRKMLVQNCLIRGSYHLLHPGDLNPGAKLLEHSARKWTSCDRSDWLATKRTYAKVGLDATQVVTAWSRQVYWDKFYASWVGAECWDGKRHIGAWA